MVIFLKKNLLKYSLTKFYVQMKNLVLEIQIHVQTKYYTGWPVWAPNKKG